MDDSSPKSRLGLVGAGAAACAVCCTGPILGFVTAVGAASLLGLVVFGVLGFAVVTAVGAVLWQRRRRRRYPPAHNTALSAARLEQVGPD